MRYLPTRIKGATLELSPKKTVEDKTIDKNVRHISKTG